MTKEKIISLSCVLTILAVLYFIGDALTPFIISLTVSYLFLPVVNFADRNGIGRGVVSVAIIILVSICIASLILFVMPFVASKISNFIQAQYQFGADDIKLTISRYIEYYFPFMHGKSIIMLDEIVAHATSGAIKYLNDVFIDGIWISGARLVNFITILFVCPFITFYILKDWNIIRNEIVNLIPHRYREDYIKIITSINTSLSGYLHGQVKVCLFLSLFYSILLQICGLNFGLVLGILIGFVAFIPYIGFIIGLLIATVMAALQFSDPYRIGIVAGILVLGQIIEGNFVTPRIIGSSVDLHPNWVVFGLFVSVVVCGAIGAIFALPITAIAAAVVRFISEKYKKSTYYSN